MSEEENKKEDPEVFNNKMYRIRRTVLQMLSDRNYDIGDQLEDDFETFKMNNYDILEDQKLTGFTINCTHRLDHDDCIQVRFDRTEVNVKVGKEIFKELSKERVKHCIFIVKEAKATPKIIEAFQKVNYKVEFFTQKEMMINITHHNLVPKHEPLTEQEKEELLRCYKITELQLPYISRNDPICRYFGVEPGIVMRITRKSNTAGRYVTYRLVV